MQRKKLGLALGSGGWRGYAHLGVLKILEEEGIRIDYIAGCPAGSLIGGLFAKYQSTEYIEKIVDLIKYSDLIKTFSDVRLRGGIVKGEKVIKFLDKYLNGVNVEDLPIKFRAISADLLSGNLYEFTSGSLSEAIKSSCSIPLLITPTKKDGMFLVDGAVIDPIPVETTRRMGADIVLAVDLYTNVFPMNITKATRPRKPKLNTFQVGTISYRLMLRSLSNEIKKRADIVIEPKIPEGRYGIIRKFASDKHVIDIGVIAMRDKIDELKKLLE